MATRRRAKESTLASKASRKSPAKKTTKKASTKSDELEYESMKEAKPESEKADTFKVDDKKQKKRIGFPLSTPDGGVAMVKVHYFKAKFGTTLADGKWHSFQAPTDEDLLEACRNHPLLDEKTERATIVIVYDTNSKGAVYGKGADIGYELLAMKINNPKLIELQDIDEDEDLTAIDLTVRLDPAKDIKFQDMRFKSAGDALWSGEMDMDEIVEEAKDLSKKLKEVIAYKYDNDKIEALIGDGEEDDDDYDEDDDDYDEDEIEGDEEEEAPAPRRRARKSRR